MANKKYKLTDGTYWATDGIHDFGQNKTQREINAALVQADSDLSGAINDKANQSAIAIVSDNNTHEAVTKGHYIYVKNHGSLSEGLYTALADLAANAVLNNGNTYPISEGGLNDLIKVKHLSGTTQSAGQFNTGIGSGTIVIGIKCEGYISFAQLSGGIWYGFLKKWDLTSPVAISYSAYVYYISL